MNNPTNWFIGDNKWYEFMAIGTILAVLFIPVVIFVLVKFFGLKFQFDKTSATITKLLTMVKVIPPFKSECYLDESDWQILEIISKIGLFSVLIYVSYKFVKFVMSYVNINNLAEIQSDKWGFRYLIGWFVGCTGCTLQTLYAWLMRGFGIGMDGILIYRVLHLSLGCDSWCACYVINLVT